MFNLMKAKLLFSLEGPIAWIAMPFPGTTKYSFNLIISFNEQQTIKPEKKCTYTHPSNIYIYIQEVERS